jgi:hypothetical protein
MDHQKNTHEAKVKKAAGFEDKGDEEKTVDEEEKTEKSKVLEEEAFDAHLKQLKSEMETLYQAVKFISGIDKSVSAVAKLLHSSTKTGACIVLEQCVLCVCLCVCALIFRL